MKIKVPYYNPGSTNRHYFVLDLEEVKLYRIKTVNYQAYRLFVDIGDPDYIYELKNDPFSGRLSLVRAEMKVKETDIIQRTFDSLGSVFEEVIENGV